MSAYLEAVDQARERRETATGELSAVEAEFRAALARAHEHHSLREIARHAGITHAGVKYLIEQEGTR